MNQAIRERTKWFMDARFWDVLFIGESMQFRHAVSG